MTSKEQERAWVAEAMAEMRAKAEQAPPPAGRGMTPAERAAFLDQRAAQSRAEHWRRSAVPPRTGDMLHDLAAADEAVRVVEGEWDRADLTMRDLRSRMGPFPSAEDLVEVSRAERHAAELWQLRQAAVRNRDQLEAGARWEPLDRMPGWSR